MCTRPTPSYRSVTASSAALGVSVLDLLRAVAFLLLALAGAPLRHLARFARQWRPASSARVDVQVHLGDASCVAELEAIVWKTLTRAERTWAPLPLPLDRVVIGAGFPPAGRTDIYEDFVEIANAKEGVTDDKQRRVVVSLGVRDGTRDLDGWEIAGALAAQIQSLVDEQCRQHRSLSAVPAVAQATARVSRALSTRVDDGSASGTTTVTEYARDIELPPVADTLEEMLEAQPKPLAQAGPRTNGTHI